MKIAVIIAAAGAGTRFSGGGILVAETGEGGGGGGGEGGGELAAPGRSKLDEDLGGRPVLQRTVELFTQIPEVAQIVVAGPADDAAWDAFRLRHGDRLGLLGATLCRGGRDHRYETIASAMKVVDERASELNTTHVAVHDAARPCASPELIQRVLDAAEMHGAAIPAIDVPDTLKRVGDQPLDAAKPDPIADILGGAGASIKARLVEETIDRTRLVAVQTPQVFALELLRRAYAQHDLSSTDDSQLVERLGEKVVVVPGDPRNIKITRPADVPLARAILGLRPPAQRETHKRF